MAKRLKAESEKKVRIMVGGTVENRIGFIRKFVPRKNRPKSYY